MAVVAKGEFGFIDDIKVLFDGLNNRKVEGIGDDCAVMRHGEHLTVVTTDMLIEGVHFLRDATSAYLLGRKSLAVNLSDVAAMGAQPTMSLLSIAIPRECQGEWVAEFMRGYHSMSEQFGVALVGGDTTSSLGAVAINVVAFGEIENSAVKRRSAARVGDMILVTGTLGESGAGLRDILQGKYDTELAMKHKNPTPCVDEGVWLGGRAEVRAMMDLSDGLASDVRHIMEQSGVGADIDVSRVPYVTTIEDAVNGGEDYKLLLTADSAMCNELCAQFEQQFGYPLSVVGEITDQAGTLRWFDDSAPIAPSWAGFQHF